MFPAVAEAASRDAFGDGREPLVTAAPDAYGFWLPEQRVRRMRPGIHGAILLDAAQRLYEPRLTADGAWSPASGAPSPSHAPISEIDTDPAVLVVGSVVIDAHHK